MTTEADADDTTTLRALLERLAEVKIRRPDDVLSWLKTTCSRHSIRVCSDGAEGKPDRVILSCKRFGSAPKHQIWFECNGIVIDASTWAVLSVPPRALNNVPRREPVESFLKKGLYDIIRVEDGTVVTLYQWSHPDKGPIWCMSTGNGYDVSALRWMSEKTFAETMYEVIALYPEFAERVGASVVRDVLGPDDVRLQMPGLDPAYSYSFGFRHHEFQPLKADPAKLWFIQAVSREDLSVLGPISGPEDTGQATKQILALVPCQTMISWGNQGTPAELTTIEDILALSEGSLEKAIASVAPEENNTAQFLYGHILRSRCPEETGPESDILIRSKLLCVVRNFMYRKPPRGVRAEIYHRNRLEFVCMSAFLNQFWSKTFLSLYPQFETNFHGYEAFLDRIATLVVRYYCEHDAQASTLEEYPNTNSVVSILAMTFYKFIRSADKGSISPFRKNAKSLVLAYLMQPCYALMYVKAIIPE